jgi:hypothetical protein
MKLKQNQLVQFERAMRQEFIGRMVEYAIVNYPNILDLIGETDLNNKISDTICEAEKYGFLYEEDIEDYLDIMLDNNIFMVEIRDKNIDEILMWPDRSAERKLNILREYLMFDIN